MDLARPDDRYLQATGVFYLSGAVHTVTFDNAGGVVALMKLLEAEGDDSMVARMYLTPQGETAPSANLRFHFNREHQVAAAVLVALDKHRRLHSWMTRGDAGRDDVTLVHDSWNPDDTALPPESFIFLPELRPAVVEFAFLEELPPPSVRWASVPDIGWS
ncbi:MAG TPA: hypothetical protein VGX25_00580 [Actinophytocola sp.]|uniref:hypothetical protein n=1 Tax=Actinophytocola sp. TaxID=1872138 RepID=UPI002DDCB58D|nr:hypothetical protein [Actinophytocola sp.]HEV2777874.1 hypothetical protein [Actinophytocola sp.]